VFEDVHHLTQQLSFENHLVFEDVHHLTQLVQVLGSKGTGTRGHWCGAYHTVVTRTQVVQASGGTSHEHTHTHTPLFTCTNTTAVEGMHIAHKEHTHVQRCITYMWRSCIGCEAHLHHHHRGPQRVVEHSGQRLQEGRERLHGAGQRRGLGACGEEDGYAAVTIEHPHISMYRREGGQRAGQGREPWPCRACSGETGTERGLGRGGAGELQALPPAEMRAGRGGGRRLSADAPSRGSRNHAPVAFPLPVAVAAWLEAAGGAAGCCCWPGKKCSKSWTSSCETCEKVIGQCTHGTYGKGG
jgi:hypothetical protein